MTPAQMLKKAGECRAEARAMIQRARFAHRCNQPAVVSAQLVCARSMLQFAQFWRFEAQRKQVRQ